MTQKAVLYRLDESRWSRIINRADSFQREMDFRRQCADHKIERKMDDAKKCFKDIFDEEVNKNAKS